MYASSWFLTLFTSNLPLHIANRVMDLFLSEGIEIIFRLSIAILQMCRDDLLKLDMEGLLRYFQKEMPGRCEIDPDYLVNLAINVKLDQKKMKKLAKDYSTIKAKEQEELVELRVIENHLKNQPISHVLIDHFLFFSFRRDYALKTDCCVRRLTSSRRRAASWRTS